MAQTATGKAHKKKYNTNLAAEFHALSMLHRLGLEATLTIGNKKAVDASSDNSSFYVNFYQAAQRARS